MPDSERKSCQLGPVFWRAFAYEGVGRGIELSSAFLWASCGASDINTGRPIGQDDASQCLLSMKALFEQYLKTGGNHKANGPLVPTMTVVVERLPALDARCGRVVARLEVRILDGVADVRLQTGGSPVRSDFPPLHVLESDRTWQLFSRVFAHL
jgi:hypothetical protein